MKRIIIVFMVLTLMFSSVCYAEEIDLTTMSDDELIALRNEINIELENRAKANETAPMDGLVYVSNGTEVHIKGYTGTEPNLVIPETINGVPVVAIDDNAFEKNLKIKSVTIPSSIKYIGNCAFDSCKYLKTVVFPKEQIDTLEIGYLAFAYTVLTGTVVINAKTLTVGWKAFESVNRRGTPVNFVFLCDTVTLGEMPFADSKIDYVYFKPDAKVVFKTPDYAFYDSSIKALYLPDDCTTLGDQMFKGVNLAVIYCRNENCACITEARNKFLLTDSNEYEIRTTQILNEVAGMGYIFE